MPANWWKRLTAPELPTGRFRPGYYAPFLKKANENLEKARGYAEPGQDAVIAALIRYYQTGDPADWIRFGIAWVGNDRPVDFANGFIEVYRERSRRQRNFGSAFVSITDAKAERG